jgi:Trypsin-like peptidase domain
MKGPRGFLAGALAAAALLAGAAPASAGDWTLGGVPCELIEVPAAAPVGTGPCPGVRPGAVVASDNGQCTFNFLFHGSDGRRYMGTAGHCILGEDPLGGDAGEQAWAPGTGPEARDGAGNRIGEFAYAVLQDPKDFALIRLDPGVQATAQMCHFGGPTGVNTDQGAAPVVLNHFGQGVGVGSVLPGRSALALGMPDPDHVYAAGAVVPGDSGSGIISSDGRAVGVIVTTGLHTGAIGTGGIDAGSMGVTRIAPQVARAGQVTGVSYALQTAGLL